MNNHVDPCKKHATLCCPLLFIYKRCSFYILILLLMYLSHFLQQANVTFEKQSQCFSLSHPQVSVTAYVSERCSTANLNLHVCLFTGQEDTVRCPPPRHATRSETAQALRGLAHAGNGRFLWTTETGEERLLNDCLNDGVFQGR